MIKNQKMIKNQMMIKKINKINLLGIQLFLLLYIKYGTYLALIVYIIGIIYHSFAYTYYGSNLRIYDKSCNILIMCYIYNVINRYITYTYISRSILVLIINLINKYKFNSNQIIHVVGVHIPTAYNLYLYCLIIDKINLSQKYLFSY
jgi:hypothetical protein